MNLCSGMTQLSCLEENILLLVQREMVRGLAWNCRFNSSCVIAEAQSMIYAFPELISQLETLITAM